MTRTYLTSLRREGKYWKTTENVKKKKTSFSFVFYVLRGERCENGKKKCFYSVRGVMGCQRVRGGEGKMKSPGKGREEDGKMLLP